MISFIFIILNICFAQVPEKDNLLVELPSRTSRSNVVSEVKSNTKHSIKHETQHSQGNLPSYAIRKKVLSNVESPLVIVKTNAKEKFSGLIRSSLLKARINDSIIAYEGSLSSVRAVVNEGPYSGAVLFGNATMDKVTKSAVVTFDTFVPPHSSIVYKFQAEVKAQDGSSGIPGKFESDYWRYFWTQIALDTASASANATTQFTTNAFGQYQLTPGLENIAKQGVASGLAKTADRLSEKNQFIPEYVVVEGPIYIRVAVKEQPEKL